MRVGITVGSRGIRNIKTIIKRIIREVKERKGQLQLEPQVVDLQVKIKELKDRQNEISETLSNHLVNHHRLTNSTSFDTSEGDQWEYKIQAKIKAKPKSS